MPEPLTWDELMARKGAAGTPEPGRKPSAPSEMPSTAPEPPAEFGATAAYRRALGRDLTPAEQQETAVVEAAQQPGPDGLVLGDGQYPVIGPMPPIVDDGERPALTHEAPDDDHDEDEPSE